MSGTTEQPVRVLFVCLGNICRSPSAEGVFREKVKAAGLQAWVETDSCGTGDWHIGKSPDARAVAAAAQRGIAIADLRARQFQVQDLQVFDYILAMDQQNLNDLRQLWRRHGGTEPCLFLDYAANTASREVPDPYFGGDEGFAQVLDLIEAASEGLLAELGRRHGEH